MQHRTLWLFVLLFCGLAAAQDEYAIYEGGMAPGYGENPNEPNALASANALQWVTASPTLDLRQAPAEHRAMRSGFPFLVGYELEPFDRDLGAFAVSGWAHTLKGALALKRWESGMSAGARLQTQYIRVNLPGQDSWFLNNGLGAFLEKDLLWNSNQIAAGGAALDILLYDKAFAQDLILNSLFGAQITAYGRWTHWINAHRMTLGGLLQQSFGGRLMQSILGLSAQYAVFPVPSIQVQSEAQYRFLVFQHLFNSQFQPDPDRVQMNIGIGATWWYSQLVGVELGYKATLLIDGYRAHTLRLGSRFSF